MIHRSFLLLMLLPAVLLFNSCKHASKTDEYYRAANDLVLNSDFVNAKKNYLLAIEADTTNWRACYQLAGVYQMEGDFRDAAYYFSKTVAINPKCALGFYARANLLELVGDEKGGMRDLKTALDLKKDLFLAQLSKGRKEYSSGKYQVAIEDLNAAIALRQDFFLAFGMRGNCKLKTGDLDGAIKDFDKEIQLRPDYVMGYVSRAMTYTEQKNYRAAINDINTCLNADPLWSQGYIYRGMIQQQAGAKDSACIDFNLAYKMKNPQAEGYVKEFCGK
jgi:tetratricopeptide (TPR) repeat protein